MFKLDGDSDEEQQKEASSSLFSVWEDEENEDLEEATEVVKLRFLVKEDEGYEDLSVKINPAPSPTEPANIPLTKIIDNPAATPANTPENMSENPPKQNGIFSLYLRHKITTQRRTPLALVKRIESEVNKIEQNKVNVRACNVWLRLTEKMAFKQLLEVLSSFKLVDDEMIRFISDQGLTLLKTAILDKKSAAPLVFICEHVRIKQFTKDDLGDMLSHDFEVELKRQLKINDYESLRLLLNQHPELFKSKQQQVMANPSLKLLALKLQVLSKIDPIGVAQLCGGEVVLQSFIDIALKSRNGLKLT